MPHNLTEKPQTAVEAFENLRNAVDEFKATMKRHPVISTMFILYAFLVLKFL